MNSLRLSALVAKRGFSTIPAASYLSREVVADRVLKIVRSTKFCPVNVNEKSFFVTDLGFDSAIRKDLNTRLAEEFCVRVDAATRESFLSVDAAVKYFASHPKAR